MLVLFADTDMDMTPEMAEEYGYHLISMPYSVNGEVIYPYESFDVFDSKAFYTMLRGGTIPTTSAISEERYLSYFEPHFKNGDDILYVHFSANMTNTFEFMESAVKKLQEKYPARKFYRIDTKGITIPSLMIALEVGKLIKNGKTPEEVLKWAETEVDKFACYFTVDDLRFFHRSGRVGGLSATMGTLIGIRPIITMNSEGKMVSCGKEKGHKKALKRLVQYVLDLGEDIEKHRIIIGNSDCGESARELADMVREATGKDLNILITNVNPTAGSHCGPDCTGICFHAVHR